jgi:hypothetical protein
MAWWEKWHYGAQCGQARLGSFTWKVGIGLSPSGLCHRALGVVCSEVPCDSMLCPASFSRPLSRVVSSSGGGGGARQSD